MKAFFSPVPLIGAALVVTSIVAGGFSMGACTATGASAKGPRLAAMKSSPQWKDGRFTNALEQQEPPFFQVLSKWIRGAKNTAPEEALPIAERSASDFSTLPESGLRITWLGHSTLLVEIDGKRVLVDPVWGQRASPFSWMGPKRFHAPPLALDDLPAIDAVVISHDHYDHLDHRTIIALGDRVPLYAVPLGVGAHLESWGVPAERIVERDWWGEVSLGDVSLIAVPARHFSGRSTVMADRDQTLWSGWVLKGPEHRIYYSGDTAMFPGFADIGERLGPFDVSLIETGAYNQMWADVHLGPEQAIEAHRLSRGRLYVPVHWGTFDLALHPWTEPVERLLAAADLRGVDVAVPRIGQSIDPSAPPELVRWWPLLPWQTAEQAPVVSSGLEDPPHEAEAALPVSSDTVHGVAR